ncbi:MAG: type III pantothenate kinase [Puniceicoccales bacterium]|jgi:type III pantothenate kinase|nr:type III pantothenate kinase [Puniceicoccales bacterium]
MNILCLDIGNTHTHHGVLSGGRTLASGQLATASGSEANALAELIKSYQRQLGLDGIAFCSVVPRATEALRPLLDLNALPVWHLRHDACPGLAIHYPCPAEIGQDRLANCIGAQTLHGAPAVVIDMGTAVTFDILTDKGYEGGVIAPGLGIMTRYLHEQTALLPQLDPADLLVSTGIGKSTLDGMRLGCTVGFAGMMDALLSTVLEQLTQWGVPQPAIFATGGTAGALPKSWQNRILWEPDITLLGLETAFYRSRA